MSREWKPGDVAVVTRLDGTTCRAIMRGDGTWRVAEACVDNPPMDFRPLAVIDPEDREQVERLAYLFWREFEQQKVAYNRTDMRPALREFADPTPAEPTDPKALVTDRRDNVWRLLADGEWVCTSGPDIGEYLAWDRLASERGPVEVQP